MAEHKRVAVVDDEGTVLNVIVVDDDVDYTPEAGSVLVDTDSTRGEPIAGGKWDGQKFEEPELPEVVEVEIEVEPERQRRTVLHDKLRDGKANNIDRDEALMLLLGDGK